MNHQEAIQYIESLALIPGKRPGLGRIEKFLSCHGSPQHAFTALHVGGTNGKGSTVAMLDSILREGKLKVGRFTGPHLLQFNERFHINGQSVSDSEFVQRLSTLKTQSELFAERFPELGLLSWFELLTAFAFSYFADQAVDIAVIEVGLGGRFDATNVLQKLYATGITNIALEHEHILGNSLEEIAMEKAGIIKAGIPIITGAVEPALSVLSKRAAELQAKLIVCSPPEPEKPKLDSGRDDQIIFSELEKIKADICRHGGYQYANALLALNMLRAGNLLEYSTTGSAGANNVDKKETKKIPLDKALQGLKNFYWPGRFQIIESENMILDGAHNPAGVKALRESLDYLFPGQRFHFVFACYADKDGQLMLRNLVQPGDSLYLGTLSGKRSFFANLALAAYAEEFKVPTSIHSTVGEALAEAKIKRRQGEFIVVAGYLFSG